MITKEYLESKIQEAQNGMTQLTNTYNMLHGRCELLKELLVEICKIDDVAEAAAIAESQESYDAMNDVQACESGVE
ncbi:MAG: hypothetical protein KBD83_07470 [Gammaproteobacteria bacterium]|nr:hypothetical protein [Gammaproteobacteria bacterium]